MSVHRGDSAIATVQADGVSGYWVATVALVEGSNLLTAVAELSGTSSDPSAPVTIVLDTTPPDVPAIGNAGGETAPSRMHVIRGTAEPSVLVEVFVNGTWAQSAVSRYDTGQWFIKVLLAEGTNTVTARTVDGLGNPSAMSPVLSITAPQGQPPAESIEDPPKSTSVIRDNTGTVALTSPFAVAAFEHGGRAYAAAAAGGAAAVQVIDFTDPSSPEAAEPIKDADRNLGQPRDIEIFTAASGDRIAAVASHRPGAVELIDMSDPLMPEFLGAGAAYGDKDEDGAVEYPGLLGARDASVFSLTNASSGEVRTYLIVASDYGRTDLDPGGFQILDITTPAAPVPVSSKSMATRNENGDHTLVRPLYAIPWIDPAGSYALNTHMPKTIATYDAGGDPVAAVEGVGGLPGYGGQSFDLPTEVLQDQGGAWALKTNTIVQVMNSTNRTVSMANSSGAGPVTIHDAADCPPPPDPSLPVAVVCGGQNALVLVHNADTPGDKSDDYVAEVYADAFYGTYSYPVAKRVDGRLLAVGPDLVPFPLSGVDAANATFNVLGGAGSVDTFAVGGGAYAIVAASESGGVQIVNVTDPYSPMVAAGVLDGETDANSREFRLEGAAGVRTWNASGRVYAAVSYGSPNGPADGVQIIDVTDPSGPTAVSRAVDVAGTSRDELSTLGGAAGIEVFERGGRTYLLVAASEDDGFQIIDVTDPASPAEADRGRDGSRCSTAARYSALGGAVASDTLAIGGGLYAVVAAESDDGVQVVDIADPDGMVALGTAFDERGGFSEMHDPISAEAVEIDGRTYVLVASFQDDEGGYGHGGGVQIIDVTDPSDPRAAAALQPFRPSQFKLLEGVRYIDTFVVGGSTYAIITAESPKDHTLSPPADQGAFTIADISNPTRPRFIAGVIDGQSDVNGGTFDMLNAPAGVETAVIDGRTYAVIAARGPHGQEHGVQIVDVSTPASPLAVASIRDGGPDGHGGTYSALRRAHGVDIAQIGEGWYALVASIADDGVQLINITDPSSPRVASNITDAVASTNLDGARNLRAFEKGGNSYAIVVSTFDDALQVLNITDPASPVPIDTVTDHSGAITSDRHFTELVAPYDIDLFELGGDTYAASTCQKDGACHGMQITNMSNPAQITAPTEIWDEGGASAINGARGVATFEIDGSVHALVTGYGEDAAEVFRLTNFTDPAAPSVVRAELDRGRGMLHIEFSERVKTGSMEYNLGSITVRDGSTSASVGLSGARLAGQLGGQLGIKTVEIAMNGTQAADVRGFESPLIDLAAGAFADLSGTDSAAASGIIPEIVTSRPELLEAGLNLGTGELVLAFTEAVDYATANLSRISVYSAGDEQVRHGPVGVVPGDSDSADLTVRLGEGARQAVMAIAGVPLVDVLDGAVNSSASNLPSVGYRGSPLDPVIRDRVDPVLLSALLSGSDLRLVFNENVIATPDAVDLALIYVRDRAGESEVSLNGSTLLTNVNGTELLVRLTAAQSASVASYGDPVVDLRLGGPYSAVQDVSGQGSGPATVLLASSDGSFRPTFEARAVSPSQIRVEFSTDVAADASDTRAWLLGGRDAGVLSVASYPVPSGRSALLTLSGALPSTAPVLTLEYVPGHATISGADSGRELAGAAVDVADGIPPVLQSARIVSADAIDVEYSEPVAGDRNAYSAPMLESAGDRTVAGLADGGTAVHRITLGGDPAATGDTGTIGVDETALADLDGNALGTNSSKRVELDDGQAPAVASARITGSNTITVEYSEPVVPATSAYIGLELSPGGVRTPTGPPPGHAEMLHAVTFDPGAAPNATGTLTINRTVLFDGAGNRMEGAMPLVQGVWDGQSPTLERSAFTGHNSLTLGYSEPVAAPLAAYTMLMIDGDPDGREIVDFEGNSTDRHVLEFNGAAVARGATGSMSIDAAAVLDLAAPAKNALAGIGSEPVGIVDDRVLSVVSAKVTGPGNATIQYNREVAAQAGDYTSLMIDGSPREVLRLDGGGSSDAHVVWFSPGDAPPNATGSVRIDAASVRDGDGNQLGTNPQVLNLTDGQAPAVSGATAVSLRTVLVEFSEPVSARGTDGHGGWRVSGGDSASRSVLSRSGTSQASTEMTLTLDGDLASTDPDVALSYTAGAVDSVPVIDAGGNALDTAASVSIADGIDPVLISAVVTAGNTLTVRYSEPVEAPLSAYAGLTLPPADDRPFTALEGNGTAIHNVTFGGAAAAIGSLGNATVDAAAVHDLAAAPNPLGDEALVVELTDAGMPSIASARIVRPGAAVVEYDKPSMAPLSAYLSITVDGLSKRITDLSGSPGRMHTIGFAPADARPNATGTIVVNASAVSSLAGIALGNASVERDLADGQAPGFGAEAVSLNMIRAVFDEPVHAAETAGAGGWSVSGADAAGIAVSLRSGAPPGSGVMMLALDGNLSDTAPDGVVLLYDPASGSVQDAAGNRLRQGSAAVADRIAPAIASAFLSGGNNATVRYTEPVNASADPPAYSGLALSPGGPREIARFTAGLDADHTVEFGGAPAAAGATGTLAVNGSLVLDGAGNRLAGGAALAQALDSGPPAARPPPAGSSPDRVRAASSAVFATPNTVVIMYSHALAPPPAHAGPVYGSVVVDLAGGPSSRAVVSEDGIGTAEHTVRFGGDPVGAGRGGTIELLVDLESTAEGENGTRAWHEAGRIRVDPAGPDAGTVVVSPSQPVRIVEIVRDSFERTVNATAAGAAARPAINVTGLLVQSPSAPAGAAVFPADRSVVVAASFAEVSFPPNVTATLLPADGLLELYVAPDRPNASSVSAALGYDEDSITVNRAVEVGDDAVHIYFDLPVRILLAGQAGGSAFYVNNTSGAVVPISAACRADGTAAVHGQLGGSGECQIDSGEDKAIHTYHLTVFGTASIGDSGEHTMVVTLVPAQPGGGNGGGGPPVVVVPPGGQRPQEQPQTGTPFFGGGGGGGRGGGGGGGGGSIIPTGSGGPVLYSASWDCGDGTVRMAVNSGMRSPDIAVVSSSGTVPATLADVQDMSGRTIYEAPLPVDGTFSIRATAVDGRAVSSVSEAVRTGGACTGETVFRQYVPGDGTAQPAGMSGEDAAGGAQPAPAKEDGQEPPREQGQEDQRRPDTPVELPPPGGGAGAAGEPDLVRPAFEIEEGRDASYYVKRYAEQPAYREWFDSSYPQYADICEAVGAAPGCVEAHLAGKAIEPKTGTDDEGDAATDREPPAVPAAPGDDDSGCLIATAAYGTELAPQVQALREYRDGALLATGSGSAFMSAFSPAYYAFSPYVADLEREHPALRQAVAAMITPMLYTLQVAAQADPASEGSVLSYGIAAILLVSAVYAGVPAAGAAAAAWAVRRCRRRGRARPTLA